MSLVDQRIGNIRIESQLGAGGMGEVYAGYDEKLRRKVAVKAIHTRHQRSAEVKARFLQEARVLSQLEHPNICRIHDYIEHEGSELLVLEYIDGKPLNGRVANELERTAKLEIAEKIADVLAAAHAAGIVHRDLKPDNVMLTTDGEVKVLDFGLAHSDTQLGPDDLLAELERNPRAAAEEAVHAAILQTEIGSVLGTPAYMSPEQARGEPISAASDCYSYGLLLQELFSGKPPVVEGEDIGSVLGRAQRGERVPPEGLDGDVGSLCGQLTLVAVPERATAVQARERIQWIRGRSKRVARRVFVAIGVLVAVLATLKYTMDLDEQRNIAVYERGVALGAKEAAEQAQRDEELARQEADRRRGQAEELLSFAVGDLVPKLREIGRLAFLQQVTDAAAEYFEAVPASELTPTELSRRSQALNILSDIQREGGFLEDAQETIEESLATAAALGKTSGSPDAAIEEQRRKSEALVSSGESHFYGEDLDAALVDFEESLRLARSLADATGESQDLFRQGQAEFWVGWIHYERRDYDHALLQFRRYLDLSERLVRLDPDHRDWQLEVAYGYSNLASVYESLGLYQAAAEELLSSHAVRERLVAAHPDNVPWKRALGISHNKLGVIRRRLLQLDEAERHFREDLRLRTELVEHDPANAEWKHLWSTSHFYLASLLRARGAMRDSLAHFDEQLRIADELLDAQPNHPFWRVDAARARLLSTAVLLELDEPAEALQRADRSAAVFEELARGRTFLDPRSLEFGWARCQRARALAALGRFGEAIDEILPLVDELRSAFGELGVDGYEQLAELEYYLGEIFWDAGDDAPARDAWQGAARAFAALRDIPNTLHLRALWCSAHLRLGQVEIARPQVEALLEGGFRRPDLIALCEAHGLH